MTVTPTFPLNLFKCVMWIFTGHLVKSALSIIDARLTHLDLARSPRFGARVVPILPVRPTGEQC